MSKLCPFHSTLKQSDTHYSKFKHTELCRMKRRLRELGDPVSEGEGEDLT